MKMPVRNDMVKEVFGRVIYLGKAERFEYDGEKREYTDKKLSQSIEVGCEKLENSITVQVDSLDDFDIPKFADLEFIGLVYDPYATVSTYNSDAGTRSRGVLTERFRCEAVRAAGAKAQGAKQ